MKAFSDWTTRNLFSWVHGNCLVYNTCWEDPRLDREVMGLGPDAEVVLITSAGCNALDYALDTPRSIHAVDMNYRQNALLELKMSGIRNLEFDAFYSLFGEGGHREFPLWYKRSLRADLSNRSRTYWDRRLHYFSRPHDHASFYHRGTTGLFGRLVMAYFRLARVHEHARALFQARSLEEQREIYFGSMQRRFWRSSFKRALRTDLALSLLGIPKAQRDHLETTCAQSVADFMEDCVEAVCTRLPIHDNYFWHLYVHGRYSRTCCPSYLKRENFQRLKGGLVDRISVHTSDLTRFVRNHASPISHYVLLDHMDWLSHENPESLRDEWQALLAKAQPRAKFLWRSGGFKVDYVDPLIVRIGRTAARVGELLRYHETQARDCHSRDRVHTYGSFYVAELMT